MQWLDCGRQFKADAAAARAPRPLFAFSLAINEMEVFGQLANFQQNDGHHEMGSVSWRMSWQHPHLYIHAYTLTIL